MRRCVLGCPKGITLHKFPDDQEKRQEWLKLINMEDCPLSNLYLCTRHFARRLKGKSRLVWNAVPTRNLLGVDESDIESAEIDYSDDGEVENKVIEESKSSQSPNRKTRRMMAVPNTLKTVDSKGQVQYDPLHEPSKVVTDDELVNFQVNFVDDKALKVIPKTPSTIIKLMPSIKKNPCLTEKSKRPTRSTAPKITAPDVIKHQIKIIHGKAYKINVPVTNDSSTDDKRYNENTTETLSTVDNKSSSCSPKLKNSLKSTIKSSIPVTKLVKNCSDINLYKNLELNTESSEFEILEEVEAFEKQENDEFMEEVDDDEGLYAVDYTDADSPKRSQPTDEIITEFKQDIDDYNEFPDEENDVEQSVFSVGINRDQPHEFGSKNHLDADNDEEQSELSVGINKDQPVEFGKKNRSRPRKKVGFVECFTNNNTFCLTCFYCGAEFELWDWQQFIEHLNKEHLPKRKSCVKTNFKHKWEGSFKDEMYKIEQETMSNKEAMLTPKVEQYNESEEGDIDMALENDIENVLKDNSEHVMQLEDDSMQTYDEELDDNIELCDEEDWQVDKLEEYEDIEVYEDQGSNMDDIDVEDENEEDEEDDDYEQDIGNEDNVRQAVINFKTTDQSRVLAFLKLLRKQPVLWHPRRYGPPIYDEEMKNFIKVFDDTMTSIDFRRSVENLRYQYKRFTPLTPRGRAKLQQDSFLRESIQIIKEIADKLSKPFVFHCDVCSFRFLDENRMLTHKYLKHKIGDLKYICSCGVRFAYERQKIEHENLHKLKPRFTCELCGSNFIFNRLLRDHMNESHPETQANPLPYKCSKCDLRFPSIIKRGHHMERHKVPKYHCEICNQSYTTSFRFRHHMKRHQDQRDWVCEHCGKSFVERRNLNAHRFRVHRDGGLKCVYCRTFFACQESLDTHNEKFHPNGTNLDRMKKIRKFFNTKYKYKYQKGPKPNGRNFKCKDCGKNYKTAWALVDHKRESGHDLQSHNCPYCDAVLSSPKTLMGHLRRLHKLPIATMSDLRNELMQASVEEHSTIIDQDELDQMNPNDMNAGEGLELEQIEIFEAYDIE